MSRAEHVVSALQRHRWVVLFLLVLSAAFASRGALKVGVNNSLEIWFVEDDPQLQVYKRFQEEYGNDEVVVLALRHDEGVLTQQGMDHLHRLSLAVESVEGISEAYSPMHGAWIAGMQASTPPRSTEPTNRSHLSFCEPG